MARVCYAFGLTPADYRSLTLAEHDALQWLLKQVTKKGGG
jgi:hypothetical protein